MDRTKAKSQGNACNNTTKISLCPLTGEPLY